VPSFIEYNGGLTIHTSLLNVVLHDERLLGSFLTVNRDRAEHSWRLPS
jgi:hypothetical protein